MQKKKKKHAIWWELRVARPPQKAAARVRPCVASIALVRVGDAEAAHARAHGPTVERRLRAFSFRLLRHQSFLMAMSEGWRRRASMPRTVHDVLLCHGDVQECVRECAGACVYNGVHAKNKQKKRPRPRDSEVTSRPCALHSFSASRRPPRSPRRLPHPAAGTPRPATTSRCASMCTLHRPVKNHTRTPSTPSQPDFSIHPAVTIHKALENRFPLRSASVTGGCDPEFPGTGSWKAQCPGPGPSFKSLVGLMHACYDSEFHQALCVVGPGVRA